MPKQLTLAIVIPAYNEERNIKACLDSIAAQTVPPDEVIVVDNNSTDKTAAIARRYRFVRLIKEKNQGIVFARDAGFNAARSDLIGRIDADTILPATWVAGALQFYERRGLDRALTGGVHFYNLPASRFYSWLIEQAAFGLYRLILGHHILLGSNMVLPAKAWRSVKRSACRRNDIHEDIDLAIHLNRLGYTVTVTREKNFRARVKAKRVFSDVAALRAHFFKWPTTLRAHGGWRWTVAWLCSALLFFNPALWAHWLFAKYVQGYRD